MNVARCFTMPRSLLWGTLLVFGASPNQHIATETDPSMATGVHQVVLVEQPGETSIHIRAEILANGDFQLSGQDLGKAPMEIFGDSDYEYWLTVPAAQKDSLLLALLESLHKGDVHVVSKIKAMCAARNIPCEFSCY